MINDVDIKRNDDDQVVFFIIGSTGSKKSNIAVELAKLLESRHHFSNIVIINCDVAQFYDGLPIATNKPSSEEELGGVPHLFLAFLNPDGSLRHSPETPFHPSSSPSIRSPVQRGNAEATRASSRPGVVPQPYLITDYERDVVKCIESHFCTHKRSAVIVCGGTSYYMQAVLFKNTILSSSTASSFSSPLPNNNNEEEDKDLESSKEQGGGGGHTSSHSSACSPHNDKQQVETDGNEEGLWEKIHRIDPQVAYRYHPHDTRRLQRLWEIYEQEGIPPSALFASTVVSPRFARFCIIWTSVDRDALPPLLSRRVDAMIRRGLLSEVAHFYRQMEEAGGGEGERHENGRRKGYASTIRESIGFKEFIPCMGLLCESLGEGKEERECPLSSPAVAAAVESVKMNTSRYARQQLQFIQNRLVSQLRTTGSEAWWRLLRLDTTTYEAEAVREHLQTYLCRYVFSSATQRESDSHPPPPPLSFPLLVEEKRGEEGKGEEEGGGDGRRCDVCDVIVFGRGQMGVHLRSKRHRGVLKRQRLEQEQWEKFGRILPPHKKKKNNDKRQ